MLTVKRFAALDVMRGLTVAAMLLVNNAGDWSHVYPWLEHAASHGCTPADFIFPFFLFIMGASLAMSLEAQISKGIDVVDIRKNIFWRSLRLFTLGIILHIIAWV
ncbi:heparan-alpha-glucosaminide N-acetyltransferase domain-containing protein [Undibacterium sp. Ji42W]|uniref:heparan-alpha-glucosaminide N-acetyltransferase domain-containing protein n=1 Tax=Undibacterium sp. Ji42W TaxID=3413039 RepID=UPI003BF44194